MINIINNNLETVIAILSTIVTALAGLIANKIKNYLNDKTKREIVASTVRYVEQVSKTLGSDKKFAKAKEKAIEWLNQKGIKISETELEVLIESAVKEFTKKEGN